MTLQRETGWERDKEGLGIWPHRGKVAIVGYGHSPLDRRWEGTDMDKTLGRYAILAVERAMEDAGVSAEQIDGLIVCPQNGDGTGGPAGRWAPRPYFDPPYDSEEGLSIVTNRWLLKNMNLPNIQYCPDNAPAIGEMMGMASEAVATGKCHTTLVIYTMGNLPGRYRQGGATTTSDYAKGNGQWTLPWGNYGGNMWTNAFPHEQYNLRYGGEHDDVGPFVVNQHRNGRLTPWSFYVNNEPYMITLDDYKNSRYILRPLRIWDCDRPVNTVTAYLFSTAERAKDMRQKPIYVLNHNTGGSEAGWSSHPTLDEIESWGDRSARMMWEGSGLSPKDVDLFNPYDGYSTMVQFHLEAFQYHGVKRGDAYPFYADDIRVEGPHPFSSSGGNLGNGRARTAMYTDSIEQLRGTAGKRQNTINAEIAVCGFAPTGSSNWLALTNSPSL